MMGGGKSGQLGIGRSVENCSDPKVVHVAGGTVHKVCECGCVHMNMCLREASALRRDTRIVQ